MAALRRQRPALRRSELADFVDSLLSPPPGTFGGHFICVEIVTGGRNTSSATWGVTALLAPANRLRRARPYHVFISLPALGPPHGFFLSFCPCAFPVTIVIHGCRSPGEAMRLRMQTCFLWIIPRPAPPSVVSRHDAGPAASPSPPASR